MTAIVRLGAEVMTDSNTVRSQCRLWRSPSVTTGACRWAEGEWR
jgi:hypothetical protein